MSRKYILIDGQSVVCDDLLAWAEWMEHAGGRVVAQTKVDDVTVSTVFIGLDHNFAASGPPVLWETMIFGGPHDGYQDRYCSLEAAKIGHANALEMLAMVQS